MVKYKCESHNIILIVDDKGNRHFDTPPGSWEGMPQCKLLTMSQPEEGKVGECEIKKVS